PLPPETELSRQMTTSTTSIDIMGLQAAYANLHTDQERDYFMQRYRDVISSFGGKTSYDADSLQRTFKKSFTSFSHSTRNKTRDGLIRVRNIRALNGRFNTSITHAYSIVI